ncbi:MAG: metal-dependent hydrolase [Halodesulfurarchaeum sp.]
MLGRHHLTLSVGTVALVVLPLFPIYPLVTIVALVGTAIGSLIPDADSQDAAIFHTEVSGIRGDLGDLVNAPGVLYPVFGYVTKYLIYKPAVAFYDRVVFAERDIRERHRGFLHSFLGLGTLTVVTGIYLGIVLLLVGLTWLVGIVVFLAGYLAGAVLHLLEDSCTRSGIQWNFPFDSWRVQGDITTSTDPADMRYQQGFLVVLGVGAGVMFLAPLLVTAIPRLLFSLLGVVLGGFLWWVFAVPVAGCRVSGA